MVTRNRSTRVLVWALALCLFAVSAPLMADPMGSAFTYQGQLNSGAGVANGSYDFRFRLYGALAGGTQIGSLLTKTSVPVANGIFTVSLDFGGAVFDGSARFLQVNVRHAGDPAYTTLSPRQELKPAPSAMYSGSSGSTPWSGLTGGGPATMVANSSSYAAYVSNSGTGDGIRSYTNATASNYASFYGVNTGTGTAVYAHSTAGRGVYGLSDTGDGVEGETSGAGRSGVYGHSTAGGVGVTGESNTTNAVVGYSHANGMSGVYGVNDNATAGYGVSGWSLSGFGVEASGNDTSLSDTVGDLLLGGSIGEIFAGDAMDLFSNGSVYVDLDNDNNGTNLFGVYNGTNGEVFSVQENGNTWVSGNLSAGGSKAGYVVDIAQNDDTVALEAGDVVAICGVGDPVLGQIPVVKVRRATASQAGAVAGVVDQAYQPQAQNVQNAAGAAKSDAGKGERALASAVYSNGPIPPGGYCTMVTLGSFKTIKVDASSGAIGPGDRLTASPKAGFAMKAANPAPGTLVGKALGSLETGVGAIPVLLTLQ